MPKKVDANQNEIVEALREAGCSVQILSDVGHGCPDLLVGTCGPMYSLQWDKEPFIVQMPRNFLLEVKSPRGKLNTREALWHLAWRGQVAVVHSVDEALAVIGFGSIPERKVNKCSSS